MTRLLERRLGLTAEELRSLSRPARGRLGRGRYAARVAAFLVATTPTLRRLLPPGLRARSIESFLFALLPGQREILHYVDAAGPRADA